MSQLLLSITVDWEGQHLSNVADLLDVRKRMGYDIPLTHFICPGYFLSGSSNVDIIKRAVTSIDEVSLHIHPLRELVEYFGIKFREEHNFFRPNIGFLSKLIKRNLSQKWQKYLLSTVSGRGVPISVYSEEEIKRMLRGYSSLLMEKLQLETISGFRAGGNMASDLVIEQLQKVGFMYDSSAFPPEILSAGYDSSKDGSLKDNYGDKNGLYTNYIMRLWGSSYEEQYFLKNRKIIEANQDKYISLFTQPFRINRIWEMPMNCGMADFASAQKTYLPVFKQLLAKSRESEKPVLINIGFHQEGDSYYKSTVWRFVKYLKSKYRNEIEFVTIKGAINRIEKEMQQKSLVESS